MHNKTRPISDSVAKPPQIKSTGSWAEQAFKAINYSAGESINRSCKARNAEKAGAIRGFDCRIIELWYTFNVRFQSH